jgi:phosphoribosylanthranilate isomerase
MPMPRVKVKICGIRALDEALAAQELGVDALGFNFWEHSPRYIALAEAEAIIRELNPFVACIGVFVNERAERVREIQQRLGLGAVQLHGDESSECCSALAPIKVIKAFRVKEGFVPESVRAYKVNAILLDAGVPGQFGGTGRSFDWRVALEVKQYGPLVLAGGLSAENVGEAIQRVRPSVIDVCSGVEAEPGRKDLQKMKRLMAEVERMNSLLAVRSPD